MSTVVETLLDVPAGYASTAVARFLAQMDDQSRRLVEATEDATVEELGWQPAPGTNTIGMLLAHIAVAETHMSAIGLARRVTSDVPAVIGLRNEDDGLPLPAGGAPPTALAGRDIGWFHDLLFRSRAHTKDIATRLTDADLQARVTRPRPDGTTRVFSVDWMLYHMLEHEAGHFGQILLMRHLWRARTA